MRTDEAFVEEMEAQLADLEVECDDLRERVSELEDARDELKSELADNKEIETQLRAGFRLAIDQIYQGSSDIHDAIQRICDQVELDYTP